MILIIHQISRRYLAPIINSHTTINWACHHTLTTTTIRVIIDAVTHNSANTSAHSSGSYAAIATANRLP